MDLFLGESFRLKMKPDPSEVSEAFHLLKGEEEGKEGGGTGTVIF